MQTTVAEMIEWLKTMPQDAKVEVLRHTSGSGYYDQGGWCSPQEFDHSATYDWAKDYVDLYPRMWEYDKNSNTLLIGEVE